MQLVLIRGLPGSGKSTCAKNHYPDHVLFEADQYFVDKYGVYKYDINYIAMAHDWCFYNTIDTLKSGQNVVVANTFVTRRSLNRYLKLAKTIPDLTIVVVETHGNYSNIHNVPDATLKRMKESWQDVQEDINIIHYY